LKSLTECGAKNAVIHLAEDQWRFVVTAEDESLVVFLALSTAATFSDIRLESRNNNVISLEVGIPNFVHALKAGATSHFVTLSKSAKTLGRTKCQPLALPHQL